MQRNSGVVKRNIVSLRMRKYRFGSLLTALPAMFMTAVSVTYILSAQEGFRLDQTLSNIIGVVAAGILLAVYGYGLFKARRSVEM